jgi:DNA-binding MarR family transcriptional regulator
MSRGRSATAAPEKPSISEQEDFERAWDEFFAAIRRARGRAAREMEREGLSLAQFQLLYAFAGRERSDGLPVGALAEAAGVAQPTATRMLDGLERQGIIERQPSSEDRRSVTVRLTAQGARLLRRKRELVAAKREEVYRSLPAADRRRAASVLRALAGAFDEDA